MGLYWSWDCAEFDKIVIQSAYSSIMVKDQWSPESIPRVDHGEGMWRSLQARDGGRACWKLSEKSLTSLET